MLYLLDTSTVIDLVRRPASPAAERVRRHPPAHIGVSSVALHELYYGAFRSERPEHHLSILDRLLFPVAEFDREDAREAGRIRASLAERGSPVRPADALIAGQARARGLVLVTADVREFGRVEGLVETWHLTTRATTRAPRATTRPAGPRCRSPRLLRGGGRGRAVNCNLRGWPPAAAAVSCSWSIQRCAQVPDRARPAALTAPRVVNVASAAAAPRRIAVDCPPERGGAIRRSPGRRHATTASRRQR